MYVMGMHFREIASTCDKVNAYSYGTNDNRMDIDPIVPIVHTPTIPDMADFVNYVDLLCLKELCSFTVFMVSSTFLSSYCEKKILIF